jgi:hypothetical protein
MRGLTKLDLHRLFEPENRGILLDLIVFFLNLTLMIVLTRLTKNLVNDAETDVSAKAVIGLYFAGLFLLQPLGPVLKRWSFHQESKFDTNSPAGCLLGGFMFFYLVMMLLISSTATIILTEVIYERGRERRSSSDYVGIVLVDSQHSLDLSLLSPTEEAAALEVSNNSSRSGARRYLYVSECHLSSDSLEQPDNRRVVLAANFEHTSRSAR